MPVGDHETETHRHNHDRGCGTDQHRAASALAVGFERHGIDHDGLDPIVVLVRGSGDAVPQSGRSVDEVDRFVLQRSEQVGFASEFAVEAVIVGRNAAGEIMRGHRSSPGLL